MFVFKLQSVLEHRKTKEDMALREFSVATVKLNAERTTMTAIAEEEALLIRQWRKMAAHPVKAQDCSLYADYIKRVQHSLRDQTLVVNAAEEEAERKRIALLAIVKERKILETLKEKQRQTYETGIAARERKTMDEIAILKFKWEES